MVIGEKGLIDRIVGILDAVAERGTASLADVAAETGLPASTVYRIARALGDRGYLIAAGRGRYRIGPAPLRLAKSTSLRAILADVGRPLLTGFARNRRVHAHLGIFDGEMVTYVVKASYGRGDMFSVEGMQLEAYCSAIGKVLLASLPEPERQRYVANGDFVALTPNTIVAPSALEAQLKQVGSQGWAMDDEEIMAGLRCLAVPVFNRRQEVCAAISLSVLTSDPEAPDLLELLEPLANVGARIGEKI